MENSKISWTTHTFNHVRGCTKVSEGCAHCYAEKLSHRNPSVLGVWGPQGTRVVAAESAWREPLRWNRLAQQAGERHRVFCASLADVFEGRDTMPEESWPVVEAARLRLLNLIRITPNLDWLLLTKRPENILPHLEAAMRPHPAPTDGPDDLYDWLYDWTHGRPPKNLWAGTSVENQKAADARLPHLLRTPAAVRFLSVEPLLGPVDLCRIDVGPDCERYDALAGVLPFGTQIQSRGPKIDWVIVGGESGPGARPCRIEWVRDLVRQCRESGAACFVKQLGSVPALAAALGPDGWPDHVEFHKRDTGPTDLLRLRNRKGGNIDEFPADLQVRQFPAHKEAP